MTHIVGSGVVIVADWTDGPAWDAFVSGATDGTVAHRWAWLQIVRSTYAHRTFAFAAVRGGAVRGVLPLALVRSRLFGRLLVSMPYGDCGGVCSDGDSEVEGALLDAALVAADRVRVPLELRQRTVRGFDLPVSLHKVTMTLDLTGGEAAAWGRVKSNRRSQVRKATRNGLSVSVHGEDGVRDFHAVLARNMRDLGSPVHRRRLFSNVLAGLSEDARILLVRSDGAVIGAGLVLVHRECMVLPFSSAVRSSFSLGTNQLLYWEAIRYAIARGCRVFDFGRSSPGSGTFEAKREWGAQPMQLYWYRHGVDVGDDTDASAQRMQWATQVWRRLPVPVASAAGHVIRGGLPQ